MRPNHVWTVALGAGGGGGGSCGEISDVDVDAIRVGEGIGQSTVDSAEEQEAEAVGVTNRTVRGGHSFRGGGEVDERMEG